jgi:hypothetical protein
MNSTPNFPFSQLMIVNNNKVGVYINYSDFSLLPFGIVKIILCNTSLFDLLPDLVCWTVSWVSVTLPAQLSYAWFLDLVDLVGK